MYVLVGRLDSLAAGSLAKLEEKLPILTMSTGEWAAGTKHIYDVTVKPTIDRVSAAKQYSVNTVSAATQYSVNTVSAATQYSIDTVTSVKDTTTKTVSAIKQIKKYSIKHLIQGNLLPANSNICQA